MRDLANDRAIAHRRLRTQGIAGSRFATAEDVVGWLGAVQSQEYAVAKWSVGQRARGVSEAALDRAIADGTVLRTHVLRPTWHFVLPADIRWMLELTAPRVRAMMASYDRKLELDDALYARSNAAFADALEGGKQLIRKELAVVLLGAGIVAAGQRLGHIVMRAELDAVICSGAPRGKQHTYALLDERAPRARSLPPDDALAELTRRYFTSHGPATLKDYMWWSSLTAGTARRGLEMLDSELERTVVAGRTYWSSATPRGRREPSPTAHLLQGYDEYVIAYSESRSVLNVASLSGLIPVGRVPFTHAVIVDGQFAGHWRRVVRAQAVTIEVQLRASLDGAQRDALEAAVGRYGRFMELPASLAVIHAA